MLLPLAIATTLLFAQAHPDPEGQALLKTFDRPQATGAAPVRTDLDVLNRFTGAKRALLLRHLASSAKWFVTEERGKLLAYRRFVMPDGRWKISLNGFYTPNDLGLWEHAPYQCRIVMGLDGPVLSGPWREDLTESSVGSGPLTLQVYDQPSWKSYLVLKSQGPALEIYEESPAQARGFTHMALTQIHGELTRLWNSATAQQQGFDPALLPPGSTRKGQPSLEVANGMQGGIYDVFAWINPGEAGRVRLKVFETAHNQPLSADRLGPRSLEYVGWSQNPQQLFLYNTHITVYEGDWGDFYPARFELWFEPASGRPARKLLERVFRIEGWQR